jgi:hypothetical protein
MTPLLRRLLISGLLLSAFLPVPAWQSPGLDTYGGRLSLHREPTGWFRLARSGERHFFLTPDGNGFIALGVNHIGMLDRGGQQWARRRAPLLAQLRGWNMNNLGYGAPPELGRDMPYFASITLAPIEKHRSQPTPGAPASYSFPDVFDPAWRKSTEDLIGKECARHRDNPYLIGYFWTDTPTWDLVRTRGLRGTDWVSEIRRLPAGAPGRRRYAEFLARRYAGRIEELNAIYGLSLNNLDELAGADLSRIAIGRHVVGDDDREFLGIIARELYQIAGPAQRKHDPNHLVLGDRYLAGDAPDIVLLAAAPHIDAVSVQPGDRYTELYPPSTRYPEKAIEQMHRVTGKPVMICDHAISYPTGEYPKTIFEQLPTREEAARATAEFLRQAMAKPYVVGYLRCQYIDRPAGLGRGLRQGLVNNREEPDHLMTATYIAAFREWLRSVFGTLR